LLQGLNFLVQLHQLLARLHLIAAPTHGSAGVGAVAVAMADFAAAVRQIQLLENLQVLRLRLSFGFASGPCLAAPATLSFRCHYFCGTNHPSGLVDANQPGQTLNWHTK